MSVNWAHYLGDFNIDKVPNIVIADPVKASIIIFLLDRNQSLIEENSIPTKNDYFPYCISTGDLNLDNETYVVVANRDSDGITVLLMKYEAIFINEIIYDQKSAEHPNAIAATDLNNGNQADLIVVNSGADTIEILMNCIHGKFQNKIEYSTNENSYPRHTAITHFDRNDQLKIAIIN